jgi:hypothetical protein
MADFSPRSATTDDAVERRSGFGRELFHPVLRVEDNVLTPRQVASAKFGSFVALR